MDIKYNICPECGYQKNNMPNFCPSCGFNYRAYINKKEEEQAQITKEKETRKAEAKAKMIEEKGYFREGNEIYFGEYFFELTSYKNDKPIEKGDKSINLSSASAQISELYQKLEHIDNELQQVSALVTYIRWKMD